MLCRRIVKKITAVHNKKIFLFIKRRSYESSFIIALVIIIMFIIYLLVPIEWPITETRLTTLIKGVAYHDEGKGRRLLHYRIKSNFNIIINVRFFFKELLKNQINFNFERKKPKFFCIEKSSRSNCSLIFEDLLSSISKTSIFTTEIPILFI